MAVTDTSKFSIGGVASTTFAVIGRNLVPFFVLTLIAALPQTVLLTYINSVAQGQNPAAFVSAGYWINFVGVELISIFFAYVLQATLTYSTVMDVSGKPISIRAALVTGLKAALPMLGIGILSGLGVGLAMILLIVPGLMLATAWIVVVPAYVVERPGILGAFGRSLDLTRGHRWAIFGLLMIYFLGVLALNLFTRPLFGLAVLARASSGFPVAYIAFTTIISMITLVISSTGAAVMYYELRKSKEGVGPEQLASVFD